MNQNPEPAHIRNAASDAIRLGAVLVAFVTAFFASGSAASAAGTEKVLSLAARAAHESVAVGGSTELLLSVELHGHWHINSDKPRDPLLIPTRLTINEAPGVTTGAAVFPPAAERRFEFSDEPLLVFEGRFVVRVPLTLAPDVVAGDLPISGKMRYQACDDERCLAPKDEPFALVLKVAGAGTASAPTPSASPVPQPSAVPEPTPGARAGDGSADGAGTRGAPAPAPAAEGFLSAESVRRWFEGGSYLRSFAIIFLIGLALNLTPCVYPVIPLTLGYFAFESERRGGKTFSLAVTYVLGMALMYSSLGVFAALSGKAFGSALSNPWVLVFEAAVMVALALSMFGLYEISVPGAIAEKISASPSGHMGALFMGLTVGIVAAPCLAPAVLGLFVLVAQLQSVALGFGIFFVLALGLGLPFLVLGTAAGAISRLPRSGEWMVWIKHVFGVVLLGMALYFLRPSLGTTFFLWALVVLALAGGLWLGWIDRTGSSSRGFRRIKVAMGLLFLLGAGTALSSALRVDQPAPGIIWTAFEDGAYARATEQGRPILIDFTAEYCLPCKELDHRTFSQASVTRAADRFVALRADGTVATPEMDALLGKFEVQGYPTVLFIDSRGRERKDLRVVGFLGPKEFLARLEQVD